MIFKEINQLKNYINIKKKGAISLYHQNLDGYTGMVFYIGFVFNSDKEEYHLNLEWMCLGLDFYGDTLVESYVYQFKNLERLLFYLESKYQIKIENINISYKYDDKNFPNPMKNSDEKLIFEEAWKHFQTDFNSGVFLDKSQELIYSSLEK